MNKWLDILEKLNEILNNNKVMAEEILANLKPVPKMILDYKIIQEDIESSRYAARSWIPWRVLISG